MNRVLERVRDVRGLYASALFDPKGELLASLGAHPAFAKTLASSGPHLSETFSAAVRRRAPGWDTSILRFERGTLVIGLRERLMLVLWGTSTFDVVAATSALNAALAIGTGDAGDHRLPLTSRTFAVEEPMTDTARRHISKR